MAHDEPRDLRDERKEKRSGGGSRADRAERAKEREKLADQRSDRIAPDLADEVERKD